MMCSYYKSIYDIYYVKWAGASIRRLDDRLTELKLIIDTVTSEQAEKHVLSELLKKYMFFRGMAPDTMLVKNRV